MSREEQLEAVLKELIDLWRRGIFVNDPGDNPEIDEPFEKAKALISNHQQKP
jgi:hypothetical protein